MSTRVDQKTIELWKAVGDVALQWLKQRDLENGTDFVERRLPAMRERIINNNLDDD